MPAASLDSEKAVVRGASGVPQPAVFRLESPAPDSGLGGWPATSRGDREVAGIRGSAALRVLGGARASLWVSRGSGGSIRLPPFITRVLGSLLRDGRKAEN